MLLTSVMLLALTGCGGSKAEVPALASDYSVEIPIYEVVELTVHNSEGELNYDLIYTDFVYDAEGNLDFFSRATDSDDDGGEEAEPIYEYDENGWVTKIIYPITYQMAPVEKRYGYVVEYQRNAQGQILEYKQTDTENPDYYLIREYTYYENGFMETFAEQTSDFPGEIFTTRVDYTYNADGTIRSQKSSGTDYFHSVYDYVNLAEFSYNSLGYISEYTLTQEVSNSSSSSETLYRCSYDPVGHLVSVYMDPGYGDGMTFDRSYIYDKTASVTKTTESDDFFKTTDTWTYFDECKYLPLPSSVISGVNEQEGNLFGIDTTQDMIYNAWGIFNVVEGMFLNTSVSSKNSVYDYLTGYLCVAEQVLGYDVTVYENGGILISKDDEKLAVVSTGFDGDLGYYLGFDFDCDDITFSGEMDYSFAAIQEPVADTQETQFVETTSATEVPQTPADEGITPLSGETSGICGENLTWTFVDGTLTISGDGEMVNYSPISNQPPWIDLNESITKVVCQPGVSSIGDFAFKNCFNVISISISDTVKRIGHSAFGVCTNLSSLTIPEGVATIEGWAFANCYSLKTVSLSRTIAYIGDAAFTDCSGLNEFLVDEENPYFSNDSLGVLYNKDKTTLLAAPGAIGETYAIPDGVEIIGNYSFRNCDNLSSITISDSVTTIGEECFSSCANLMTINIPNSVAIIGDRAFWYCESLDGIWVEADNSLFCSDSTGVLFNKSKTELLCAPVSINGNYVIPDSVLRINSDAFAHCAGLDSVSMPSNLTDICEKAFLSCTKLKNIIIPESTINIERQAFWYCENLLSITLPIGICNIKSGAFDRCTNLSDVYYMGTQQDRENINIRPGNNDPLLNATWHYNSTGSEVSEPM